MTVDLVLMSVGGVQRFVAESRKTVDMAGASIAMRRVVLAAASLVRERLLAADECGLIFPAESALGVRGNVPVGVTNKVAFLAPDGSGSDIAAHAAHAVRAAWTKLVEDTYRGSSVPATPGMPAVSWVCVRSRAEESYTELWERAQKAMRERGRVRVFTPFGSELRRPERLCGQSPALLAAPAPSGVPLRERRERLSAQGWVKRAAGNAVYGPGNRFPSTAVVASTAYRARLIGAAAADEQFRAELAAEVAELVSVVDGDSGRVHRGLLNVEVSGPLQALSDRLGVAVNPDAWGRGQHDDLLADGGDEQKAARGRAHAQAVRRLARRHDVTALTPYYAVVISDMDRLGRRLSTLDLVGQRDASRRLIELGDAQTRLCQSADYLSVPLYAGGDDLMAFAPAAHALSLVTALRQLVNDQVRDSVLAGLTASATVVFAHYSSPLRAVVTVAQEALSAAKDAVDFRGRSRDALSVVVLRRGGERTRTVLPWTIAGEETTTLLERVAPSASAGKLSARLAASVEEDAAELEGLERYSGLLVAEVRRRIKRQGGSGDTADALVALGRAERSLGSGRRFAPLPAALTARFLAQECR